MLTGALVFMMQLFTIPHIHNHPMNFQTHYDCPAYILSVTLISFLVLIIISINFKTPYFSDIQLNKNWQNIVKYDLLSSHNKSPPINSCVLCNGDTKFTLILVTIYQKS